MITIRRCSDWIVVHHNGEMIYQGHSVNTSDMSDILSNFDEVDEQEITDEEMESEC